MVPISGVAFYQGKIKHSNEFLVHLGADYFVQRTAHECQPIIERRVEKVNEKLKVIDSALTKHYGLQDLVV